MEAEIGAGKLQGAPRNLAAGRLWCLTECRRERHAQDVVGAQALADSFGAGKAGVPVFLFLDKTGRTLASSMAMPNGGNIGHPVTPEEIKAFDGLLAKTAPHMTAAERQQIADHLAKQKI